MYAALRDAISGLVEAGWPVVLVVSTVDAPPEEIPPELVAHFPEELVCALDPEKLKHGATVDDFGVTVELAFARLLGGFRLLRIPYSRIVAVQFPGGFVPGSKPATPTSPSPPPQPPPPPRHALGVRGDGDDLQASAETEALSSLLSPVLPSHSPPRYSGTTRPAAEGYPR